uniref:PEP-utilizers domain-containing protein n=1 Tax=Caenorhabditis tropicalis TaxID=1561998 RepID=A0A1I7TN90_9PELO
METTILYTDVHNHVKRIYDKIVTRFRNEVFRGDLTRTDDSQKPNIRRNAFKMAIEELARRVDGTTVFYLTGLKPMPKCLSDHIKQNLEHTFRESVKEAYKDDCDWMEASSDTNLLAMPTVEDIQAELLADIATRTEEIRSYASRHREVWPPAPKEGDIVVPTGGLAKCICSPGCTVEVGQPAYRVLSKEEIKRLPKFKK